MPVCGNSAAVYPLNVQGLTQGSRTHVMMSRAGFIDVVFMVTVQPRSKHLRPIILVTQRDQMLWPGLSVGVV